VTKGFYVITCYRSNVKQIINVLSLVLKEALLQDFAIPVEHGRRKDIFQRGDTGGFFQNFSRGGAKSGYIWVFPLETKKITFFAGVITNVH